MGNLWWLFLVGLATGVISEKLHVSSQSFTTTDDLYIEGRTSGDLPIDDEDGQDDGSGSGSGDYAFISLSDEEEIAQNLSRVLLQPQPTADSPHNPPTTAAYSQDPATTVKDTETRRVIVPGGDNKDEEVPGVGPAPDWFIKDASPSTTIMPLSDTTSADDGVKNKDDEDMYDSHVKKSDKSWVRAGQGDKLRNENSSMEKTSGDLWERTEVLTAVIACGVVAFLCAVFLLLLLIYRMKKKDEGSYDLGDNKNSTTAYHQAPTKEFYA